MVIEKHKVTFGRQLELFWPCILINIFTVAVYLFVIGVSAPIHVALIYFGLFFSFNLLPALILHIQYLKENKSSSLILNLSEQKLYYKKKGYLIEADFSQVERLQYYGSYGRNSWYTFGGYEFCKVLLSSDEEIIITSVMVKEVKKHLQDALSIKAEDHLKFLALITNG